MDLPISGKSPERCAKGFPIFQVKYSLGDVCFFHDMKTQGSKVQACLKSFVQLRCYYHILVSKANFIVWPCYLITVWSLSAVIFISSCTRFFGGLGVTFHPMRFDLDWNHLEQVFGCLNEIIIAFCELGYTRKGAVEYISDCPIVVTI